MESPDNVDMKRGNESLEGNDGANKRIKTDSMKKTEKSQQIIGRKRLSTLKHREKSIEETSDVSDNEKDIDSELTRYELLRLENIKDNEEFLATLRIAEIKEDMQRQLKPKPVKREKKKKPLESKRVSLRLANMDPVGTPLPADLPRELQPFDDHGRRPDGPLEMAAYLGYNNNKKQHEDLMDKMKSCIKCKAEKIKENKTDLESYLKTFSKIKINTERIAKVVPNRKFSLAIHPSSDRLITAAGDKWGFLGIWDVLSERSHPSDGGVVYTPHCRPISCLRFSPYKYNQLYSCSFDGTFRCCDLEKGVFDEIYSVPDDEEVEVLLKNFDFLSADSMLVSKNDGTVAVVDTRTPGCKPEGEYRIHNKWLNTVHVHPVQNNFFCSSSSEGTVCLWDLRLMMKRGKNTPWEKMKHGKSVVSAYFSPLTGKYILSTSLDNRISILNCEDLNKIETEHSIVHNTKTKEWLTNFRATWHPCREDLFVVGSLDRPRKIDFYGGNGKKVLELTDEENLASVCAVNVIGRSQDVVVGANSSGKVHVWM